MSSVQRVTGVGPERVNDFKGHRVENKELVLVQMPPGQPCVVAESPGGPSPRSGGSVELLPALPTDPTSWNNLQPRLTESLMSQQQSLEALGFCRPRGHLLHLTLVKHAEPGCGSGTTRTLTGFIATLRSYESPPAEAPAACIRSCVHIPGC